MGSTQSQPADGKEPAKQEGILELARKRLTDVRLVTPWERENPPQTPWERVKTFYEKDTLSFERAFYSHVITLTVIGSFMLGGMINDKEVVRRIDNVTKGVTFGSPSMRFRATMDQRIIGFIRNGTRVSFKACLLMSATFLPALHLTLWRDKYAAWYIPASTVPTYTIVGLPAGAAGGRFGFSLGVVMSFFLSAPLVLYGLYTGEGTDAAYRAYRNAYAEQIRSHEEDKLERRRIMADAKLFTNFGYALRRTQLLREKAAEEQRSQLDVMLAETEKEEEEADGPPADKKPDSSDAAETSPSDDPAEPPPQPNTRRKWFYFF